MSGFYGVMTFEPGARACREDLAAMDRAIAHWGERAGCWQDEGIAFGAKHNSPGGGADAQPLVEPDLILVGHVRLDGRENLIRELGLDRAQGAALSDCQLFAHAWRLWGEASAQHVLGDWVCALWDRRRRRLWVARDAAGNTGLYFWRDGRQLIFSTSLPALLAHPGVPRRPDPGQIARKLLALNEPGQELATEFLDIQRLPGGYFFACDGGHFRVQSWWRPEELDELPWSAEECYEAFRELYEETVRDRLCRQGGRVGLLFSSGLDSGSVASIAAPALAQTSERLLAYVAVPAFRPDGARANRCGDEGPLARAAAEHIGHMDLRMVRSEGSSLIASLLRMLEVSGRPGHAVSNQYWIHDILRMAREQGVSVMLTGQGGNGTVSWTGTGDVWPDLRVGRFSVLREALVSEGFWAVLRCRVLKPLLRTRRHLGEDWNRIAAIRPELAAEADLSNSWLRTRDAGVSAQGHDSRVAQFRLGRFASAGMGANWMEAGAAHGVDVRDPTRDRRLIEFCWRTPDRLFWAGGLQRGLIRRGMSDCLPSAVLRGKNKGLQAADIGYRILEQRDEVLSALEHIARHPLVDAWLDVPKMRAVIDELTQGVTPVASERASSMLLRGLCFGLFLTQF